MKIRAIAILLLFAGLAAAQIAVPRLGCFVDGARRVRPVFGVAGNFLIGEPEGEEAVAAVCSDNLVVIKHDDSLEVRTRDASISRPAPAGTALFRFPEHGAHVLVYIPESGEWLVVDRVSVRPLSDPPEVDPAGALSYGGGRISIRGAELVLTNSAGEENTIALPGRATALEWLGPGWVHIWLAENEGHLAFSVDRKQVYRLPEVAR